MKKLTIVEELERQLDTVRLGKWLKGNPQHFQQACLVVRTDAKIELTPDEWTELDSYSVPDRIMKMLSPEEEELLVDSYPLREGWCEQTKDGGWKMFITYPSVLSKTAQEFVASARQELKLFTQAESYAKQALIHENMEWNDRKASKAKVEKVLALALEKAKTRYSHKKKSSTSARAKAKPKAKTKKGRSR